MIPGSLFPFRQFSLMAMAWCNVCSLCLQVIFQHLPNIIERLSHCFYSNSRMVQRILLLASAIVPTMCGYCHDEAFLHLQALALPRSPRVQACVARPSPLMGGVWA